MRNHRPVCPPVHTVLVPAGPLPAEPGVRRISNVVRPRLSRRYRAPRPIGSSLPEALMPKSPSGILKNLSSTNPAP